VYDISSRTVNHSDVFIQMLIVFTANSAVMTRQPVQLCMFHVRVVVLNYLLMTAGCCWLENRKGVWTGKKSCSSCHERFCCGTSGGRQPREAPASPGLPEK